MVVLFCFTTVIFDEKIINDDVEFSTRKKLVEVFPYLNSYKERAYLIYTDQRDGFNNNLYLDIIEEDSLINSYILTDFPFYPVITSYSACSIDSLLYIVWNQLHSPDSAVEKHETFMDVVNKKTGEVVWNNVRFNNTGDSIKIIPFSDSSVILLYNGTEYSIYNWIKGEESDIKELSEDSTDIVSWGWTLSNFFFMIGREGNIFYFDTLGNLEGSDRQSLGDFITSVPTPDSGFIVLYIDDYDNSLRSVKFSKDKEKEGETRLGDTDPMFRKYHVSSFNNKGYAYIINSPFEGAEIIIIDKDGTLYKKKNITDVLGNYWQGEIASFDDDILLTFTEPLTPDTSWGEVPRDNIYGMKFDELTLNNLGDRFLIHGNDSVGFNLYPMVKVNSAGNIAVIWHRESEYHFPFEGKDEIFFSLLSPYEETIVEPLFLKENIKYVSLDMEETKGCIVMLEGGNTPLSGFYMLLFDIYGNMGEITTFYTDITPTISRVKVEKNNIYLALFEWNKFEILKYDTYGELLKDTTYTDNNIHDEVVDMEIYNDTIYILTSPKNIFKIDKDLNSIESKTLDETSSIISSIEFFKDRIYVTEAEPAEDSSLIPGLLILDRDFNVLDKIVLSSRRIPQEDRISDSFPYTPYLNLNVHPDSGYVILTYTDISSQNPTVVCSKFDSTGQILIEKDIVSDRYEFLNHNHFIYNQGVDANKRRVYFVYADNRRHRGWDVVLKVTDWDIISGIMEDGRNIEKIHSIVGEEIITFSGKGEIELFDIGGRRVKYVKDGSSIELKGLSRGIYFYTLRHEDGTDERGKIIKIK